MPKAFVMDRRTGKVTFELPEGKSLLRSFNFDKQRDLDRYRPRSYLSHKKAPARDAVLFNRTDG